MSVENKQTFEIDVTRLSYGSRTISVQASSLEEAQDLALDEAGNHLYKEHDADYVLSDEPTPEQVRIEELEQRVTELEELLAMALKVNQSAPALLKPAADAAGDHEVTLPDFIRVMGASYLCELLPGLKERGLVPSAEGITEIQTDSRGDGFDLQIVKASDPQSDVAYLELLFPEPEDLSQAGSGHAVHLSCVKPSGEQMFSFIPMNFTDSVYASNATELKNLMMKLPHSTAILASLGAL